MKWQNIIKGPLKYDSEGIWVVDKDGGPVLKIRGYGKISSKLQYDDTKAEEVQDAFAKDVTKCLNEHLFKKR